MVYSLPDANLTTLGDTLTKTADRIADDPDNRSLIEEEFAGLYLKYQPVEALFVVDRENRITSVLPADNTLLKSS